MLNKSYSSKKRVMSASMHSEKRESAINQKAHQKRFGRTYTESNDTGHVTKGQRQRIYTSTGEHFNKVNDRINKAPEELVQQNFLLKNQLKDLNTKLYLTKSKIESQKKKHLIYAKKLNRQFQKELYWQNDKQNQYLITGIKSQYDKLKQSYELKCQQLQSLKTSISFTKMEELTQYCAALEDQNKILLENITFLKKKQRRTSNLEDYLSTVSKNPQHDLDSLLDDVKGRENKFKIKIKKLQEEENQYLKNQSELIKKINFLEKLMIEKQNESYHCRRKVKEVEKQKNKLLKIVKVLEDKILQNQKLNTNGLEELKAHNERQVKLQKAMFQKAIRQKNIMIQKLQKQIGYLSTLLTQWKPMDQLDKFDRAEVNSSQKEKSVTGQSQPLNMQGWPSKQTLNRTKTPINFIFPEESNNDERFLLKSAHNQEFLNKDLSFFSAGKEEESKIEENLIREVRRSSKKWTQEAKKCRKVQQSQVEHLGELIKFKMIAHRKTASDMKDYFSCKLRGSSSSKLQQDIITMKQVKQILISDPFQLSQSDAHLLSRYLIQDQCSQFVYCHQRNELQRAIVKSIIKALVGEFTLPDDSERCQQKWSQIKRSYCYNMQLMLKTVCPKGEMRKDKFLDMFKSLGIDIDQQTKQHLIGRLVKHQTSLSSLKYDSLFSAQQIIQ